MKFGIVKDFLNTNVFIHYYDDQKNIRPLFGLMVDCNPASEEITIKFLKAPFSIITLAVENIRDIMQDGQEGDEK